MKKKASNAELADMIASAVNSAVKIAIAPLETQLAANHNIELDGLKTQMKAMVTNKLSDSVIDKMDPQEMKDHLAVNGQVGFSAQNGQHVQSNSSDLLDSTCPE